MKFARLFDTGDDSQILFNYEGFTEGLKGGFMIEVTTYVGPIRCSYSLSFETQRAALKVITLMNQETAEDIRSELKNQLWN